MWCFAVSFLLSLDLVAPAFAQGNKQQGNPDQGQQPGQSKQPDRAQPGANSAASSQQKAFSYTIDFNQGANKSGQQAQSVAPGKDQQNVDAVFAWTRALGAWTDHVNRGTGMSLAAADDALRAHLKLGKNEGLVVNSVDANSPAAQVGIQQNDVLLKLDNVSLGKPEDLEVAMKRAGEKPVLLVLLRGGMKHTIEVQPQIQVTLRAVPPKPPEHQYRIGVSVSPIEAALGSQLHLSQGLIVNDIMADSPAAKAGIKLHDILVELDGQPLRDPGNLAGAVQVHGEKAVVLHLIREGKQHLFVDVTPERRQVARVSLDPNRGNPTLFEVVQPGALLGNQNDAVFLNMDAADQGRTWLLQARDANQASSSDASAPVSKRLDALDAELKQLRKAIEALSKAMKDKKPDH
jgi:membrane-associated protease RseP (regulator of RpoE activity)